MNTHQHRVFADNCTNNEIEFRSCCANNLLNATFEGRSPFISEAFHTRVGSKEILVIFKAGKKNTPLDRAFDIYLPKDIETGIYELNTPDRLIEIAFTENFPAYATHWTTTGTINLVVCIEKQQYTGTIHMKFKDREGDDFGSETEFCFSLLASALELDN